MVTSREGQAVYIPPCILEFVRLHNRVTKNSISRPFIGGRASMYIMNIDGYTYLYTLYDMEHFFEVAYARDVPNRNDVWVGRYFMTSQKNRHLICKDEDCLFEWLVMTIKVATIRHICDP